MITASHNKYTDNGVKISGLNGESIDSDWEEKYTNIVNSKDLITDLKKLIQEIYHKSEKNKYFFRDYTPIISLAYDTRRSSPKLIKISEDALTLYSAKFHNYGVLTTPALQFLTYLNQMLFKKVNSILSQFYFVNSSEYWMFLKGVYMGFNNFSEQFLAIKPIEAKYENEMLIDCANGAAAFHFKKIAEIFGDRMKLKFININYEFYEGLNEACGAEHLHKIKTLPLNYTDEVKLVKNLSFDGDVDRIIYL